MKVLSTPSEYISQKMMMNYYLFLAENEFIEGNVQTSWEWLFKYAQYRYSIDQMVFD